MHPLFVTVTKLAVSAPGGVLREAPWSAAGAGAGQAAWAASLGGQPAVGFVAPRNFARQDRDKRRSDAQVPHSPPQIRPAPAADATFGPPLYPTPTGEREMGEPGHHPAPLVPAP